MFCQLFTQNELSLFSTFIQSAAADTRTIIPGYHTLLLQPLVIRGNKPFKNNMYIMWINNMREKGKKVCFGQMDLIVLPLKQLIAD